MSDLREMKKLGRLQNNNVFIEKSPDTKVDVSLRELKLLLSYFNSIDTDTKGSTREFGRSLSAFKNCGECYLIYK